MTGKIASLPASSDTPTRVGDHHVNGLPPNVRRSVAEVAEVEARDRLAMPVSARLADHITAFTGSMLFVGLHAIWFGTWITLNLPGMAAFDPYPFGLLTTIVSLEAIFLSTFVLISQNRQSLRADRRATIDLELNAVAEHEITKLIHMVEEIHDELGLRKKHDEELRHMKRTTDVRELADAVDEVNGEGHESPDDEAKSRQ